MATKAAVRKLVERLRRGETLTNDELQALMPDEVRPRGRQPRPTLKRLRDELGRAAMYAIARANGKGYDAAIAEAMERTASSERRIKGALSWLESVGMSWRGLVAFIEADRNLSTRIREGGIASLSADEILRHGCDARTMQVFESEFSREERAELFFQQSFAAVGREVFDRTVATLLARDKPTAVAASGLPHSIPELAKEVDVIATAIAKEIAARIRGCSK